MADEIKLLIDSKENPHDATKRVMEAMFADGMEEYDSGDGDGWQSTRILIDPIERRRPTRNSILGVQLKVGCAWSCIAKRAVMLDKSGSINITKLRSKYLELLEIAERAEAARLRRVAASEVRQAISGDITSVISALGLVGVIAVSGVSGSGDRNIDLRITGVSSTEAKHLAVTLAEARGTGGAC